MATKPWGVFVPTYPPTLSDVTTLATLVNSTPNYVMWYHQWRGSNTAFTASDFSTLLSAGITPILTWEPKDNSGATHIANTDITGGTFDAYIDSFANGIKALSGAVWIRLAHEMNGNWYDWAPGNNGNTNASYVAMWQYVVNRFRTAGCTNAKWVWCANIHWSINDVYAPLYPGDSYVDYTAMDGYNYAENDYWGWRTYQQVFFGTNSIQDLLAVSSKPFFIGEIGCLESVNGSHSKAVWIEDALARIQQNSSIIAFTYFNNHDSHGYCEITTSTASQLAFTSALVQTTSFGMVNM